MFIEICSNMKNFLFFFLLSFFVEGVFGESVSVKEGDSVTLHTGVTEMQGDDVLEWRSGAGRDRIARVRKDREPTTYDDVLNGRFRDRLKLDSQTGDLTITHITTDHTGPFEILINTKALRTFSVIVVSAAPVKTVSLLVGDSVTLHTGVPEPQRYDVIQWRLEPQNSPIAEINRTIGKLFTSNTDERFRDGLQLDYLTGSLTIKNTENKHSGDYEVDIISSHHTIHTSFTVTVRGEMKSILSVMKGESVTLNSGLTEIQKDDLVWMFRDSQIAGKSKAEDPFYTSDGLKDRLKLDHQTGSLIITHTTHTDSGLYELKISSSRRTIHRRITVSVSDPALSAGDIAGIVGVGVLLAFAAGAGVVICRQRRISKLDEWIYEMTMPSVMVGEPITLNPDDVHKDDRLLWMFRSSCIAERKSGADSFTVHDDLPDKRFKGRLELDPRTGSLSIPETRTTDTGVYELLIIRSGKSSIKRFSVSVFAQTDDIKTVSVKKGESVTLETGVNDIQKVEQIQWKCGLNLRLAEITRGGTKKISPTAVKILKVKLDLDHKTGSLTIKKFRPTDAGVYMLRKIEGGNITTKLFRVSVSESTDNRNNPEEMHLNSVP